MKWFSRIRIRRVLLDAISIEEFATETIKEKAIAVPDKKSNTNTFNLA